MHFFSGPYGYRVLLMGLLLGGVGGWHARFIWSRPAQSFATRFTVVVLLLSSTIILARAVTAPFMTTSATPCPSSSSAG